MKWWFSLLVVLLLSPWPIAHTWVYDEDIAGQDTDQIASVKPSITSGITSGQESACRYDSEISKTRVHGESNLAKEFPFQLFVTPEDQAIEALAVQISGPRDAYQMAVQWIYVSEQKLNHAADKWLTPHEFLASTPHYPSNPLNGKEVSDCEEQANALVSLIRAEGIPPEEVRVVLGKVTFNDVETGHAWVELLTKGQWVALDPSWGPYWDDKAGKLIQRRGIPFDYYDSHPYPVLQVWAYYNDIYCSWNAPASWRKAAPAK